MQLYSIKIGSIIILDENVDVNYIKLTVIKNVIIYALYALNNFYEITRCRKKYVKNLNYINLYLLIKKKISLDKVTVNRRNS